ncbi:MAG: peptide deformylase [Lachnospiraceae bacterium]|nr:peptide deformylase [Lachnospiraceae bacterium]
MALRNLRIEGDEILNKISRPITEMKDRYQELIDDMLETMYENEGVGLAAVQVGVLRRIVVIDIGEGPVVLINPEIVESDGEQTGSEGCLSIPGKAGIVTRPNHVKVKALDRDMKEFEFEAEGFFARACCHEIDHLDGHLYTEIAEGDLIDVSAEADDEEFEDFE